MSHRKLLRPCGVSWGARWGTFEPIFGWNPPDVANAQAISRAVGERQGAVTRWSVAACAWWQRSAGKCGGGGALECLADPRNGKHLSSLIGAARGPRTACGPFATWPHEGNFSLRNKRYGSNLSRRADTLEPNTIHNTTIDLGPHVTGPYVSTSRIGMDL